MSDGVLRDFGAFFRPRVRIVADDDDMEDPKAVELARRAKVADMRTFVGTTAYADLRAWLARERTLLVPTPEEGSDVAVCKTFLREGLDLVERHLDAMIKLAQESLEDV